MSDSEVCKKSERTWLVRRFERLELLERFERRAYGALWHGRRDVVLAVVGRREYHENDGGL
jgi:hypothetical protein